MDPQKQWEARGLKLGFACSGKLKKCWLSAHNEGEVTQELPTSKYKNCALFKTKKKMSLTWEEENFWYSLWSTGPRAAECRVKESAGGSTHYVKSLGTRQLNLNVCTGNHDNYIQFNSIMQKPAPSQIRYLLLKKGHGIGQYIKKSIQICPQSSTYITTNSPKLQYSMFCLILSSKGFVKVFMHE